MKKMGRYFSIQMNSKVNLDKFLINDNKDGILIEGDLGELHDVSLIEEKLLEIQFTTGVLRLEITYPELLRSTDESV